MFGDEVDKFGMCPRSNAMATNYFTLLELEMSIQGRHRLEGGDNCSCHCCLAELSYSFSEHAQCALLGEGVTILAQW